MMAPLCNSTAENGNEMDLTLKLVSNGWVC